MGNRGVTLIELLVAVVMVTFVVAGISTFLPKASRAAVTNQYLTKAKNMATSKIQEIKQLQYAYVDLTPTTPVGFPFPVAQATAPPLPGCDCNAANVDPNTYAQYPPLADPPVVDGPVTYTRGVCINL